MQKLRVIAVASSEETRGQLQHQLASLDFVSFDGVVLELSDAQQLWQKQKPDLLIIDLTGRELDACLFIEVINYNVESKTVVFGLHKDLDPNIIVKAVSSGVKEYIQYPKEPTTLDAALIKHWKFIQKVSDAHALAQASAGTSVKHGQLISVFGSKGGVGTSTVAVNVAHQLHKATHKPVVLFDLDQVFSNTAVMLNFKAPYALSDLVKDNPSEIDNAVLDKIMVHHPTGLDILVACKNVLDENPMLPPALLQRVIGYLKEKYAYIVIDLPTHVVDPYHQFCVEASDDILLVSTLDIPGLYRTRQYIDLVKRYLNMEHIHLVLNRWDLKATIGLSNENLEEEFKYPIYERLPNNWVLSVEAMSLGQPLSAVSPQADLVKAYDRLAAKLTGAPVDLENQLANDKPLSLLKRLTRRG